MEFSGQSEEPIAPEQNNINASLPGSSTSNPPGIVFIPQEQQNIQQALSDINKHMGNMAALLQQLARRSSSGTNESHDDIDKDPDDELPPAKKFVRIVNSVKVTLSAFMLMMTTITHSMVRKNLC